MEKKEMLMQQAREMVERMTLEEKVSLCSGKDCWTLKAIPRLGLESIAMMDGPHGLRKQVGEGDNLGIGDSIPAVCFPTASASACSFDRELLYEIGKAIGEECLQEDVSIVLGPGVNQKRSPLCGRNFEYFSEDPIVSGELGASMIQGVQSTGVSTSLKHFAVNNQEKRRLTVSVSVDERALRELYLRAFEIAVKKGKPDTVMCAYNKLDGVYCSENNWLLNHILRNEWGFEGLVISDWGAAHDRALGVKNGLDLEMPGNDGYNDAFVLKAIKEGALEIKTLDQLARRMVKLMLQAKENKKASFRYDVKKHHELAVTAAQESTVLLKNDGGLLPGNIAQTAAVIGGFAKEPRYQGAGSSKLHPIEVENAYEALWQLGLHAEYAKGYQIAQQETKKSREENHKLIKEACEVAKGKDIVYLFVGLTEGYESEGFDRQTMKIPEQHNQLVEAVCKCNPNTVVILLGGAPMELPWINKVKAILLGYLGGEGGGRALANLLLGKAVPCAKLAETWPVRLEDVPSYHYFPGNRLCVEYRESIYIGYRYYEKARKPVLFSFGHGLSYTRFEYSDLAVSLKECRYGDKIQVSFVLTNLGERMAKEISFLFVSYESDEVFLPQKELKEFVKTNLAPNESKQITMELDTTQLGYYNTQLHDWYAPSGAYQIIIGGSLLDCPLKAEITIINPILIKANLRTLAPSYFELKNESFQISDEEFYALYGKRIPEIETVVRRPFTKEHTINDIKHTFIGKIIHWYAARLAKKVTKNAKEQEGMMLAMMNETPFFSMVASGEGMLTEEAMQGILDLLNGHYIKGIKNLLK